MWATFVKQMCSFHKAWVYLYEKELEQSRETLSLNGTCAVAASGGHFE
jgi:hypothetical protein